MIYGITRYSPLDIDTVLSGKSRTLNPNEKSDYFLSFSYTDKFRSKNCIVFNSLEYCKNRPNIIILDAGNTTLDEVATKMKVQQ